MEAVTICLYSTLTVPAILGGAVETLLESFIAENERKKKFKLTVIAHKTGNVERLRKHYGYTKFRYVTLPTLLIRANSVLINKTRMEFIPNMWEELLMREIGKADNKKVLVEGGSGFVLKLKKRFPNKDIYYHLHADIRPFRNKAELRLYNSIKKICVSDYIRERQVEAGCDKETVHVAVNGIETERFNMDGIALSRKEICKKFGLDEKKRYILFKGRIIKEKGVIELIQAFKRMHKKDVVLLICGAKNFGEKRRLLSKYEKSVAEEVKKSGNIIAAGHVNYGDIPLLHKIADICVVPSIWNEPCGLVVIEALVSGVPLICTNTGGIPQVCENTGAVLIDMNTNFIASLRDAMDELLENPEKREAIKKSELSKRAYFGFHRYYEDMAGILLKH